MIRIPLDEQENLTIIRLVERFGKQWKLITTYLPGRTVPTLKSFYLKYERTGKISNQKHAPWKIDDTIKNGILGSIENDPEQTLKNISFDFDISPPSAKKVLNDNNISYWKKICVPPLEPWHKLDRLRMCNTITEVGVRTLLPIVFTDESTIVENLNSGGIWRQRGHYPPQAFYVKEAKPNSIMIWGGIGPPGYRTKLIRFDETVTKESYVAMLQKNQIFNNITQHLGNLWIWQ